MKLIPKRRTSLIFLLIITLAIIFYTVRVLNTIDYEESTNNQKYKFEIERLRKKISQLEQKASENEDKYKRLEDVYQKLKNRQQGGGDSKAEIPIVIDEPDKKPATTKANLYFNKWTIDKDEKIYGKQCAWFEEQKSKNTDISAQEMYEKLSFEDIDGGVWKQGFEITYDESQWTPDSKLNVFIVPHSHNDPGWLMTFEQYFERKTKHILDTIVQALSEKVTRKFIWAETSYLSLWWNQADASMRQKLKRLVLETGQLELVTGGWVMTDEANSHYYATIEQMIEGHEWLRANIDASIRPSYGWSIDPFGYTPTMAYLLKQMGFDAMLVQRVHYHVKKYLAQTQRFEFNWRQSWSTDASKQTDIFCHVMPFYSYDVPHTCGPDPKVCCQFDFKRLDGGTVSCPWGLPARRITDANVEERARLLLDQYRKKSQLYGGDGNHNAVLVPLGDDFRYTDMKEAHDQFENYEKLIDYMNNRQDWHVNVQFGTLRDYFDMVQNRNAQTHKKVETFNGDFFTYADRQDHYWSGYYTSRPFYKRLDRLVEYYLRSSEIAYSFANILQSLLPDKSLKSTDAMYKQLLVARRNLGLFQHHDGITGTSKTSVVLDYGNKLMDSLKFSKAIIEQSVSYLMSKKYGGENIFSIDDVKLDSPIEIKLKESGDDEQKIVLYNPSLTQRDELVHVRINRAHVQIVDTNGSPLSDYQIGLLWPNTDLVALNSENNKKLKNNDNLAFALDFDKNFYELVFEVNLAPLSLSTFTVRTVAASNAKKNNDDGFNEQFFSKVTFYYKNIDAQSTIEKQIQEKLPSEEVKSIKEIISFKKLNEKVNIAVKIDENYVAHFSPSTGFLQELVSDTKKVKLNLSFIKYGTTSAREKSGAYLFLPDGDAKPIDLNLLQWVRVEDRGPKRHRVCVNMTLLLHCVELYPSIDKVKGLKHPLVGVWNVVDLRESHNYELAMLMSTDIQNANGEFHTDLNGFQYIKRKYHAKLTIQGNVYPMPTGAFIQDDTMRMNLLSTQSLGVTSLKDSELQVFLDRRLDQDDNRGMEQAMNDNRLTSSRFLIHFEAINAAVGTASAAAQYPTIMSQWMSFDLIHPVVKLMLNSNNKKHDIAAVRHLANKNKRYPCDLRLVNMRTMQTADERPMENEIGLILHRVAYEDCPSAPLVQLSPYVHKQCNSELDNDLTFAEFFDFFAQEYEARQQQGSSSSLQLQINNTFLTLTNKNPINPKAAISKTDKLHNFIQPMQVEAFRIKFKI